MSEPSETKKPAHFGQFVREELRKRAISPPAAAYICSIPRRRFSAILRHEETLDKGTARKLSSLFDCEFEELLDVEKKLNAHAVDS